jgi:hypothetical protein
MDLEGRKMLGIFMTSVYILGGVGVVLGVMATMKFTALWGMCRYYYAVYALLLITTFCVQLFTEPLSVLLLWNLTTEFGFAVVASLGWAIYAHLVHTTSRPEG